MFLRKRDFILHLPTTSVDVLKKIFCRRKNVINMTSFVCVLRLSSSDVQLQAAAWGNLIQAFSYDVLVVSLNGMIIMFDGRRSCVCVCVCVHLGLYYPH